MDHFFQISLDSNGCSKLSRCGVYLFFTNHVCVKDKKNQNDPKNHCSHGFMHVSFQVYSGMVYMGIFGSGSPKRHRMFSNDNFLLERLCAKAGYMSRADQQRCDKKLVKTYIDKQGVKRCVGIKTALRESAYLSMYGLCFFLIQLVWETLLRNLYLHIFHPPSPDLKLRHYPPAFGDFIAMLAMEKPVVLGFKFISTYAI